MRQIIILLALVALVAAGASYATRALMGRKCSCATAPESSYAALNEQLGLTTAQKEVILKLESQFTERENALRKDLDNADRALAKIIASEGEYTPRVAAAVEHVHMCMGELQKASIAHLFEMSRQLDPRQRERLMQYVQFGSLQPIALTANGLDSDDDAALLASMARGDERALDALMQRHQGALYYFILRYTSDETIARDIVQETFVRAWFKAGSYAPKARASAKTWLFSIALNMARDRARSARREPRKVSLDDGFGEKAGAPNTFGLQTEYPDRSDESRERLALLQNAIQNLPDKLRAPLVMCTLEGMPQKEAATILRTSAKSVELRIRRAKEKLRKWMTDITNNNFL